MASMRCIHLAILLFVTATLLAVGEANKNFTAPSWNYGNPNKNFTAPNWNYWKNSTTKNWNYAYNFTAGWPWSFPNVSHNSNRIVVGGNAKWTFGFNYTDWAIKNSPFYVNDTLVFKFDPPSAKTFPHSVYLLRNYRSFVNCDMRKAKVVANVAQGGGKGFELVLKRGQPYYFACGERNGFHCKAGLMKFAIMPFYRWKF